ncbi:hypothetical protein ACFU8Q_17690 [Streptomyces sp. NPDC057543]|uniref:hypothetical protein n=1 Tax=Streptomyces sp. NPDC057543 TaxID=3346163 RepID=UPI00369F3627
MFSLRFAITLNQPGEDFTDGAGRSAARTAVAGTPPELSNPGGETPWGSSSTTPV